MRCGSYHVGAVAYNSGVAVKVPVSMPSSNYAVAVSNATVEDYWSWVRLTVVGNLSADGFTVRVYNDSASTNLSNVWFRWVALWLR